MTAAMTEVQKAVIASSLVVYDSIDVPTSEDIMLPIHRNSRSITKALDEYLQGSSTVGGDIEVFHCIW